MNASDISSELHGQPTWKSGSSDLFTSFATLGSSRPYSVNHREWRSNPMLVAKHPRGGTTDDDTDRKHPKAGSLTSSLCSYPGTLASGFPSDFSQNPMGVFSSSSIRGVVNMDSSRIVPFGLQGVLSSSGITSIPGTAPGGGSHGDFRPFEERQREYFGVMDADRKCLAVDFPVKRESEICGTDGLGTRIGLNLGVRTYFSTDDSPASRFGRRYRANSPSSQVPMCQAEGCRADLTTAKHYHRRHKVCELHSKAPNVIAAGRTQRFCQQCSRFHLLSEFDEGKRSCRKRLADHNRRRRKPQPTTATVGGTNTDSTASNNRKSMPGHLKKASSPSTASLDNSKERTVLAGNNLQLRTSSEFKGSPAVILNVETGAIPVSGVPSLLSNMSTAQPAPLTIQNAKLQVSMLPEASREATVYHQILHDFGGQMRPDLSLSFVGGGLGLVSRLQGSLSGQEPSLPWVSPEGSNADVSLSVTGPTLTRQFSFPEKGDRTPNQQITCAPALLTGQDDARPKQHLLQSMHSRAVVEEDWVAGGRSSSEFGFPSSSNIPGGSQMFISLPVMRS